VEQARAIIDLGLYMGIGGVLTYKNSGLADVVREVGVDRLVLETDAPYLAPVPYRGKRNESAYLLSIAQFLADTLAMPLEELAAITTANAEKVFGSWS
jgi:TatD DNase family protein